MVEAACVVGRGLLRGCLLQPCPALPPLATYIESLVTFHETNFEKAPFQTSTHSHGEFVLTKLANQHERRTFSTQFSDSWQTTTAKML